MKSFIPYGTSVCPSQSDCSIWQGCEQGHPLAPHVHGIWDVTHAFGSRLGINYIVDKTSQVVGNEIHHGWNSFSTNVEQSLIGNKGGGNSIILDSVYLIKDGMMDGYGLLKEYWGRSISFTLDIVLSPLIDSVSSRTQNIVFNSLRRGSESSLIKTFGIILRDHVLPRTIQSLKSVSNVWIYGCQTVAKGIQGEIGWSDMLILKNGIGSYIYESIDEAKGFFNAVRGGWSGFLDWLEIQHDVDEMIHPTSSRIPIASNTPSLTSSTSPLTSTATVIDSTMSIESVKQSDRHVNLTPISRPVPVTDIPSFATPTPKIVVSDVTEPISSSGSSSSGILKSLDDSWTMTTTSTSTNIFASSTLSQEIPYPTPMTPISQVSILSSMSSLSSSRNAIPSSSVSTLAPASTSTSSIIKKIPSESSPSPILEPEMTLNEAPHSIVMSDIPENPIVTMIPEPIIILNDSINQQLNEVNFVDSKDQNINHISKSEVIKSFNSPLVTSTESLSSTPTIIPYTQTLTTPITFESVTSIVRNVQESTIIPSNSVSMESSHLSVPTSDVLPIVTPSLSSSLSPLPSPSHETTPTPTATVMTTSVSLSSQHIVKSTITKDVPVPTTLSDTVPPVQMNGDDVGDKKHDGKKNSLKNEQSTVNHVNINETPILMNNPSIQSSTESVVSPTISNVHGGSTLEAIVSTPSTTSEYIPKLIITPTPPVHESISNIIPVVTESKGESDTVRSASSSLLSTPLSSSVSPLVVTDTSHYPYGTSSTTTSSETIASTSTAVVLPDSKYHPSLETESAEPDTLIPSISNSNPANEYESTTTPTTITTTTTSKEISPGTTITVQTTHSPLIIEKLESVLPTVVSRTGDTPVPTHVPNHETVSFKSNSNEQQDQINKPYTPTTTTPITPAPTAMTPTMMTSYTDPILDFYDDEFNFGDNHENLLMNDEKGFDAMEEFEANKDSKSEKYDGQHDHEEL